MFYLAGITSFLGAVFFLVFSSGDEQSWAQDYSELSVDDENASDDNYDKP